MTDNFKIGDKVRIINNAYKYSSSGRKTGDEFIISKISPIQPDGNCYIFDNFDRAHYSLNLQKILMATDTRTGKRFEVHGYTDETVNEDIYGTGWPLHGRPRAHVAIDGIDSPYVPVLALTNIIFLAAEFLNDIARASKMSKANCEVADQHAQALYRIIAPVPAVTPDVKSSPTDTERLDWLEKTFGVGIRFAIYQTTVNTSDHIGMMTFRDQIDNAMRDQWIEWNGGKCPVDHDAQVEIKLRQDPALITPYRAGNLSWAHRDNRLRPYDIVAYRVVK